MRRTRMTVLELSYKYRRKVIVLAVTLALALTVNGRGAGILAAVSGTPDWGNNKLGREEIVLPGFSPVRSAGSRIELGGQRSYDWSNSLLPSLIRSQGVE